VSDLLCSVVTRTDEVLSCDRGTELLLSLAVVWDVKVIGTDVSEDTISLKYESVRPGCDTG